jgi:hypothetical protein
MRPSIPLSIERQRWMTFLSAPSTDLEAILQPTEEEGDSKAIQLNSKHFVAMEAATAQRGPRSPTGRGLRRHPCWPRSGR